MMPANVESLPSKPTCRVPAVPLLKMMLPATPDSDPQVVVLASRSTRAPEALRFRFA